MAEDRSETLDAAFRRALGLDGTVDGGRAEARRRDAASMLLRAAEKALDDGRSELAVLLCLAARRAGEAMTERLESVLADAFAATSCIRVFPDAHPGGASAVAWSPDGELLASGGADASVRLWSGPEMRALDLLRGHDDRVRAVEFNTVLPLLASCGDDGAAIVWDLAGRRELWRAQGLDASALAARFSPGGDRVAVAGGAEWSGLRDARTGALLFAFGRHDGIVVYDAVFSTEGRLLATCGDDGRALVWEVASGRLLHEIVHRRAVRSVAFDSLGRRLVCASYDGAVTVLTLADGARRVIEAEGRRAQFASFVAGGRLWIGYEGGAEVFVAFPDDAAPHLGAVEDEATISVLSRSVRARGELLVTSDQDGHLRVRRAAGDNAATLAALRTAGAPAVAADVTHDGLLVAAVDADGALRLWALDEAERARRGALTGEVLWQAAQHWRRASGRAPTQREIEAVAGEVGAWIMPERG